MILYLNSRFDFINFLTVAQTCGPLKQMVSESYKSVYREKMVRDLQILLIFKFTTNLFHKGLIQAIFILVHFGHEKLQVSLVHSYQSMLSENHYISFILTFPASLLHFSAFVTCIKRSIMGIIPSLNIINRE